MGKLGEQAIYMGDLHEGWVQGTLDGIDLSKPTRKCLECGREFPINPRYPHQKYCEERCRVTASQRMRRDRLNVRGHCVYVYQHPDICKSSPCGSGVFYVGEGCEERLRENHRNQLRKFLEYDPRTCKETEVIAIWNNLTKKEAKVAEGVLIALLMEQGQCLDNLRSSCTTTRVDYSAGKLPYIKGELQ